MDKINVVKYDIDLGFKTEPNKNYRIYRPYAKLLSKMWYNTIRKKDNYFLGLKVTDWQYHFSTNTLSILAEDYPTLSFPKDFKQGIKEYHYQINEDEELKF